MPTAAHSASSEAPAGTARPRVLVLKDHRVTGRRYLPVLRQKGFEVEAVPHGPEGLAAMVAGGFALLVIELETHRTDYTAEDLLPLEVFRHYLWRDDVPVVLFTRHEQEWTPDRMTTYGVAATCTQSTSPAEFAYYARQLLRLDAAPPTRWPPAPPGPGANYVR